MSPKIDFRAPQQMVDQLVPRGENISDAIRECIERYLHLLDVGLHQLIKRGLTGQELSLLADICNGTLWTAVSLVGGVLANAEDCELAHYTKWGVDRAALLAKLRKLSPIEDAALVDSIERFWRGISNSPSLTQPDPAKILEKEETSVH